jgi:hypothetical protein
MKTTPRKSRASVPGEAKPAPCARPPPILLATENRAELRARARTALDLSDPSLEADCTLDLSENTQPAIRILHRPTGLQASVEPRRDRERTKLVALVQLRDALYDLIQGRSRHPPRRKGVRR